MGVLSPAALAQSWQTVDDFQYSAGMAAGSYGLVVAPNGTLFSGGFGLDSSGVHGLVMASIDGGNTWSNPLDDFMYPGVSATRYDGGMAVDANGNVYAAGQALLNHTLTSRWLVRRGSDNGLTWSTVDDFSLGGTHNQAHAIATDSAGNIYVAGLASTSTGYGTYEWVVRKGVNGTSWSTVDDFGPNTSSQAFGVIVHPTAGVFVAGSSLVTVGRNSFQAWTVRRSLDGGATWTTVDTFQLGCVSIARGLGIDARGNLYAVGVANETIKGKTRTHWIVRKSTNGAGGTWTTVDDFQVAADGETIAVGLATNSAGDLFVAGMGSTTATGPSQWFVRRNPGGVGAWSTVDNFQYVPGSDTEPQAIAADTTGHVFVGGYGNDPSGTSHWLIRRY